MTISLNSWQVPGYETKVNCGFKLAGEDLSGGGSYLVSADNGVKASIVSVATKIAYVDNRELAELVTKSKALDENGARIIYTINSDITEAFKVRKVKFDGDVKANDDEEVKGWVVTFKLLEVLSKSEREQQQLDGKSVENTKTQAVDGHNSVQQSFDNAVGP
jgi:hypothetical protein